MELSKEQIEQLGLTDENTSKVSTFLAARMTLRKRR